MFASSNAASSQSNGGNGNDCFDVAGNVGGVKRPDDGVEKRSIISSRVGVENVVALRMRNSPASGGAHSSKAPKIKEGAGDRGGDKKETKRGDEEVTN